MLCWIGQMRKVQVCSSVYGKSVSWTEKNVKLFLAGFLLFFTLIETKTTVYLPVLWSMWRKKKTLQSSQ